MFYETLLQQNPNSEMAQDWCLAYGVLDHDKTINLYKLSMKRKNKEIDTAALKSFSAKASSPAPKKEGGSKKGAKIYDESMEIGSSISSVGWQGIGVSSL